MNNRIYFDMDGVLARFVCGSLKAHGKSLPIMETTWDFFSQVGLSASEFWEPLRNVEFWANLERHDDGFQLWQMVSLRYEVDSIGFLTSPGCPQSVDGKKEWLSKHLAPEWAKRAIFAERRELCAAPCKLLIDDHEPNIVKFKQHGGKGVLVPRPWNCRRDECDSNGGFDPDAIFSEVVKMAW